MVQMVKLKDRAEWLANRGRIGGSDAACILGMNPWKSNTELFLEKTGQTVPEDISDKPIVKYGTDAEPLLRELFKLDFPQYEVLYEGNNMWSNDKYPWAHASLDGWLVDDKGRKGIWECKTSTIQSAAQKDKWKDAIPDNYYCQVLHYLMVTEFDFAILKAQIKSELSDGNIYLQTKHYFIDRADVEQDIEVLIAEERLFWEQLQKNEIPARKLPQI